MTGTYGNAEGGRHEPVVPELPEDADRAGAICRPADEVPAVQYELHRPGAAARRRAGAAGRTGPRVRPPAGRHVWGQARPDPGVLAPAGPAPGTGPSAGA